MEMWSWFAQISDSTTSYGGSSGAPPEEKISWGKLSVDTPRFIIESDATIVLPLKDGLHDDGGWIPVSYRHSSDCSRPLSHRLPLSPQETRVVNEEHADDEPARLAALPQLLLQAQQLRQVPANLIRTTCQGTRLDK